VLTFILLFGFIRAFARFARFPSPFFPLPVHPSRYCYASIIPKSKHLANPRVLLLCTCEYLYDCNLILCKKKKSDIIYIFENGVSKCYQTSVCACNIIVFWRCSSCACYGICKCIRLNN